MLDHSQRVDLSDLTLDELRAFETLAQCGDYSRAAELLAITPSALSHRVDQLERKLGIPLKTSRRRGSSFVMTEAATRVLPAVQKLFHQLSDLNRSIEDQRLLQLRRVQHVRIVGPATLSHHVLPRLLREFRSLHDCVFTLRSAPSAEIPAKVLSGECDLAVFSPDIILPGDHLETADLFSIEYVLMCRTRSALAQSETFRWADVRRHAFWWLQDTAQIVFAARAAKPVCSFEPDVRGALPTVASIVDAVAASDDVALVPALLQHEIRQHCAGGGEVSFLRCGDAKLIARFQLIRRMDGDLHTIARHVWRFLLESDSIKELRAS